MTFLEKVKTPIYWRHVLRIGLLFLVLLIIISLLFNSFSDILKFDLDAVNTENFSEGKWKKFMISKIAISLVYAMWVTNRNMN
ncbi:MAG: hypothetical protein HKN90_09615 [Flavobacteriaceae bacterium]|nr:hypothetical protein [Flavobacteriaceae bacterium]